jgi:serine/threonine-protein kinase
MRLTRGEEVWQVWKNTLDANPPEADAWDGYAELSLFLGHKDEYRRVRRALLDRFAANTDPLITERIGRACVLLPASDDEIKQAVALIDFALAADQPRYSWARPYFLFAKGLSEYRQGRMESAISLMEGRASGALGPAPRLVLSMSQHRLGQKTAALKTLAAAMLAFDWRADRADMRDFWIIHVLRSESEALILPNLREFLDGKYQPRTNDERLALLGICQFQGRWSTAARLYADVFAADPKLGEDPTSRIRYNAACMASLAGSGQGENVNDSERTRWRKQARDWLRADLASLTKQPTRGDPAIREFVLRTLTNWQVEPDLAGLRDPAVLEKLAPSERQEYQSFWSDVDASLKRAKDSDQVKP